MKRLGEGATPAEGTWGWAAAAAGVPGAIATGTGARRDGRNAVCDGGLGHGSFPKCTSLPRLVQPDVSHLARLARFPGLGCKNSLG